MSLCASRVVEAAVWINESEFAKSVAVLKTSYTNRGKHSLIIISWWDIHDHSGSGALPVGGRASRAIHATMVPDSKKMDMPFVVAGTATWVRDLGYEGFCLHGNREVLWLLLDKVAKSCRPSEQYWQIQRQVSPTRGESRLHSARFWSHICGCHWVNKFSLVAPGANVDQLLQPRITCLWLGRDPLSDEPSGRHSSWSHEELGSPPSPRTSTMGASRKQCSSHRGHHIRIFWAAFACKDQHTKSQSKPELCQDSQKLQQPQQHRNRSQKSS